MFIFNPTNLVIEAFVIELERNYLAMFSNMRPEYPGVIRWVSQMVLERIADSDALYHNLEHTMMVTVVGQEILRGKHIREGGVQPEDWLHFVISLLCHDIGYVRGVCQADSPHSYVASESGDMFDPPPGSSDAALTPYHVDRGKIFVRERFSSTKLIDVDRIIRNIELTRFPVPADTDHKDTSGQPGLLRSADLIGQLADPAYMRKINALYHEFEETGTNKILGYRNAADLAAGYAGFFLQVVQHYILDGIRYLQVTQSGKQWIANLYAHVFAAEHHKFHLGPEQLIVERAAANARKPGAARRRKQQKAMTDNWL